MAHHIQASAAESTAAQAPAHHTHARKQIIRGVEDAIQHKIPGEHAHTLHAELLERIEAPDLDEDISHRPIPEIITDICRDLSLHNAFGLNRYKRRTPADIAILRQRARNPSLAGAHPEPLHPRPGTPSPPALRPARPKQHHTGSNPPTAATYDGVALLERALRVSIA